MELLPRRSNPDLLVVDVATAGEDRDEARRSLVDSLAGLGLEWGASGIILATPSDLEGPAADLRRRLGFEPTRPFEIWSVDRTKLESRMDALREETGDPILPVTRAMLPKLLPIAGTFGISPMLLRRSVARHPGWCHACSTKSDPEEIQGLITFRKGRRGILARSFWRRGAGSMERAMRLFLTACRNHDEPRIERLLVRSDRPGGSFDIDIIRQLGGSCVTRRTWWERRTTSDPPAPSA